MGLNEQLESIQKDLKELKGEEEVKSKKFKIPFFKKVRGKQAKKNFITILKVNENGHGEFLKEPIKDQTVMINGVPRLATSEYIINVKRNPLMVIPSWSTVPINFKQNHEDSLKDGSNIVGYRILLEKIKLSGIEGSKKQMAGWLIWVIGGLVVAGIVYALVTGKI
jgi:hypothetical protein